MSKIIGILLVLMGICAVIAIGNPGFFDFYNLNDLLQRIGLYGILGIGVAFVIIAGGIDLSIGSVVCLIGVLLPICLREWSLSIPLAIAALLLLSAAIGLIHGLLIAKLNLQPFVVTLCGLLVYRGIARVITGDASKGFESEFTTLKAWTRGGLIDNISGAPVMIADTAVDIPMLLVYFVLIAIVASIILNRSVWGRYIQAVGNNEEAARFSGINTKAVIISSYVICSTLAGLAGILFALYLNTVQPSTHGNFYELYAIAAAVLGGCSLRGGEGTIVGVAIGTAIMRVLYNGIVLLGIKSQWEFIIIGGVLLCGVLADELIRKWSNRKS